MWWGRIILLGKIFNTAVNSADKKMYLVLIIGELYTFLYILTLIITPLVLNS